MSLLGTSMRIDVEKNIKHIEAWRVKKPRLIGTEGSVLLKVSRPQYRTKVRLISY